MARRSAIGIVSQILAWPIALACLPFIVFGAGGVASIVAVVLVVTLL